MARAGADAVAPLGGVDVVVPTPAEQEVVARPAGKPALLLAGALRAGVRRGEDFVAAPADRAVDAPQRIAFALLAEQQAQVPDDREAAQDCVAPLRAS